MSRWLVIFALILTTNAFATHSRSLRPEWLTGIKGITNENRSDMHFTRRTLPTMWLCWSYCRVQPI